MGTGLKETVWVKGEDGVNYVAFGPDSEELPDWAAEQIGDHAFEDGQRPDSSGDGDPYKGVLKADLEDEVAKRNAERSEDDQIEVGGTGKVSDLLKALKADDKAHADSES